MTPLRDRLALLCALAVLVPACGEGGVERSDPRFSTPEHTARSLLRAYGVESLSQEQARAKLIREGSLRIRDRELFESCFYDLDSQGAANLTGYIIGALAAGKDQLRTEIFRERATVSPREGVEIVLRRQRARGRRTGDWKIVIRESVPENIRQRYENADENSE